MKRSEEKELLEYWASQGKDTAVRQLKLLEARPVEKKPPEPLPKKKTKNKRPQRSNSNLQRFMREISDDLPSQCFACHEFKTKKEILTVVTIVGTNNNTIP